jgi:pimeloyl-ACP methyl ester carboxylesterase
VWVASQAPELVRGIFLEDPPLYMTRMPRFKKTGFYGYFVWERDYLLQHKATRGTFDDLIDHVGQMQVNETETMLEVAGIEAVRERALQLQGLDPNTLNPLIAGILLGLHEPDDLLAQVRCPVRLLAGEVNFGGALDAQDVQRAVSKLGHCDATVFEGVGHMIHQERPDEYVQALQQFVSAD